MQSCSCLRGPQRLGISSHPQGGTLVLASRHHPSRSPPLVQRVRVASTETVTKEAQIQPKAGSWSPWKVLNPFKKQQQAELVTITDAELLQMLEAKQEVPLVVIFSATWCGPCKIMVQRLESLMKGMGPDGIRAVKIDTDSCPELASELKVHKLPTMFFIGPDASKPSVHYTGLMPEHVMRDMVENRSRYLGTDIRRSMLF